MRALVSVGDTTGLVDFAQGLVDLGCELVASGGAARALAGAGIAHDDTSAEMERPAMAAAPDCAAFDLVVCNLAPFTMQPSPETIDVDGPALLRAAARSYARVAVVVDPADYGRVALSYLNLFDAEAAWQFVHELPGGPAAAVIKHANPCGVAVAGDIEEAYRRALPGGPPAALCGTVGPHRPLPA